MGQKLILACLGITLACSSEDDTVKGDLIGTWVAESGALETIAYTFNEDGTFELDFMSATGTEVQLESNVGTYELRDGANGLADANGDYLFCSVSASDSTCGTSRQMGYSVDFVGKTLRLANDNVAILLEPAPDTEDPATGLITFGCFTNAGFRSSASTSCPPAQIRACVGPQGCSGEQTCTDDGSGYTACVCYE
jgi:hypothetical protein